MKSYQIILRNNEKTGLINYRSYLEKEEMDIYPKTDTDGLSIFISCKDDMVVKILKIKYKWILTIIPVSKPIFIDKEITRNLNREARLLYQKLV